tara:strand:+ start:594 stop:1037 length:444 start_codon:yes stop_codon:yes gene_type:complete
MSNTVTNPVNTNNQATFQYNQNITFLGENTFEKHDYKSTAGTKTLAKGQVMGRIHATGKVLELKSGATDGSEIPFGILTTDIVILANETPNLSICVSGDVASEMLIFDGSDDLATVVASRRLDDRIAGDTLGVKLIASTENTVADNN